MKVREVVCVEILQSVWGKASPGVMHLGHHSAVLWMDRYIWGCSLDIGDASFRTRVDIGIKG